jgi:hypothetical protein
MLDLTCCCPVFAYCFLAAFREGPIGSERPSFRKSQSSVFALVAAKQIAFHRFAEVSIGTGVALGPGGSRA